MSKLTFVSVIGGLLSCAFVLGAAEIRPSRVPVLLELFTSEGCSSCPPADRLLQQLDEKQSVPGADLIVLSEHVDYWNRLGWRDPYSSPLFSARQNEYTDRYHFDGVYTPQLAVDGRIGLVGSDARGVDSAIQQALRGQKLDLRVEQASRNGSQVTATVNLPGGSGASAVLYVVLADSRAESHVGRGENSGRVLTHVAVARDFQQVGKVDLSSASSKQVSFNVPAGAGASGLRVVAFLQDPKTGHILGAAQQKL